MKDNRSNIMVALFVIAGLIALGWLIFKFGDLPTWVRSYDTLQVTIHFPKAPGIQDNTDVLFRGYSVGRVISVSPPALLPDPDDPQKTDYQVMVTIAIDPEIAIPRNVTPRIFRRRLGSNYIELVLDEPPGPPLLPTNSPLKGSLSDASEFISEGTQRKLDDLQASVAQLVAALHGQLVSLPPEKIDQADPNLLRPNITTAVMRADAVLKNLNVFIADADNQRNFKKGLADFAALSGQIRQAVGTTQDAAEEIRDLARRLSKTVDTAERIATDAGQAFQHTAARIQNAADQLAQASRAMNQLLSRISTGQGTAARIVNDPRLYEALTDAAGNLDITLRELRQLIAHWKQDGMKIDLK